MNRPRVRDIGIDIGIFKNGSRNAITDVGGVKVGHCTLIEGSGPLVPGVGPIRTGVTVILPHDGNIFREKAPAAGFVLNGLSLIHISEPTRLGMISYAVFCLK